jgi:plasmid stabilization system protein ParE
MRYTVAALAEADDVLAYIATDNPAAAAAFGSAIRAAVVS